jgi:hypothetical protein
LRMGKRERKRDHRERYLLGFKAGECRSNIQHSGTARIASPSVFYQHTSAYVSMRQHTSACVSIRQLLVHETLRY